MRNLKWSEVQVVRIGVEYVIVVGGRRAIVVTDQSTAFEIAAELTARLSEDDEEAGDARRIERPSSPARSPREF